MGEVLQFDPKRKKSKKLEVEEREEAMAKARKKSNDKILKSMRVKRKKK